jgi:hypothetical protein
MAGNLYLTRSNGCTKVNTSWRCIQWISLKPPFYSFCDTFVRTFEPTPWSKVLLEKLLVTQLLKWSAAFYGTRRFITLFTTALHWFLSWVRWIQSKNSHHISLRSILILFSHLRLGILGVLLPSSFPTKILYAFLISPMRATSPDHPVLLDVVTIIIFTF